MRRWIAVLWHASFFVIAGALYFFFVLPRWFELTGAWPSGLGLAMRIVCSALIGLAALPVVLTYLKSRRAEFGTPQLALKLRFSAIILHVLAGALIVGAAISEVWVSLDAAGQTLFAIYGAAAAIAVLGALSFYLAYAAELPPPPPKPLRPKGQTRRRGRGVEDEDQEVDEVESADETEPTADVVIDEPVTDAEAEAEDAPEPARKPTAETPETAVTGEDSAETPAETRVEAADEATADEPTGNADEPTTDEPDSKLRNRRPSGKSNSRLFGRSRRGVALDD